MRTQKLSEDKPRSSLGVVIRRSMNLQQVETKRMLAYKAGASPTICIQMKSRNI